MERRVLVAIFLSFVVLYLYQALVVKPVPKPPAGQQATTTAPARTGEAGQAPAAKAEGPAAAPAQAPAVAPGAAMLVGDTAEHDVTIETSDVIAVFTNRGARLKSWRLKHYFNQRQRPLELVANDVGEGSPLPFTLSTPDAALTSTLNGALYSVGGAPASAGPIARPVELKFEYRDAAGVRAVKEFEIEPSSYILTYRMSVSVGDRAVSPAIEWGPAVGDSGNETSRYVKKPEGLMFASGKVQRLTPKDIAKQAAYDGDYRYAGVDDHYFMATALFPGAARMTYQAVSVPPAAGSKDAARDLVAYTIAPANAAAPLKFFVGPKDFDILSAIDRDLVRAIDFGIFAVLVVPLLRSLEWVHGYAGNYGWSIIILTIIINAIMFPLRHKSVVSMRKMQEIQPEMKAIQDRYSKLKATDPGKQKMNQEMMALYKEKGVNPASGCVPMLLTMPVLFAMWALLSTAIELRGAPFTGWIHDLSLHDPLYITPVLMGLTQMWQQRITPATGADPTQQKMMMVMPVVFTGMFLWAPAGLAIYYGVTNLWGIGQQYLTNYLIGPPPTRTVRPAAERRVKRAGSGKTEAAGADKGST